MDLTHRVPNQLINVNLNYIDYLGDSGVCKCGGSQECSGNSDTCNLIN